ILAALRPRAPTHLKNVDEIGIVRDLDEQLYLRLIEVGKHQRVEENVRGEHLPASNVYRVLWQIEGIDLRQRAGREFNCGRECALRTRRKDNRAVSADRQLEMA